MESSGVCLEPELRVGSSIILLNHRLFEVLRPFDGTKLGGEASKGIEFCIWEVIVKGIDNRRAASMRNVCVGPGQTLGRSVVRWAIWVAVASVVVLKSVEFSFLSDMLLLRGRVSLECVSVRTQTSAPGSTVFSVV